MGYLWVDASSRRDFLEVYVTNSREIASESLECAGGRSKSIDCERSSNMPSQLFPYDIEFKASRMIYHFGNLKQE
jgi:hypothetical protein